MLRRSPGGSGQGTRDGTTASTSDGGSAALLLCPKAPLQAVGQSWSCGQVGTRVPRSPPPSLCPLSLVLGQDAAIKLPVANSCAACLHPQLGLCWGCWVTGLGLGCAGTPAAVPKGTRPGAAPVPTAEPLGTPPLMGGSFRDVCGWDGAGAAPPAAAGGCSPQAEPQPCARCWERELGSCPRALRGTGAQQLPALRLSSKASAAAGARDAWRCGCAASLPWGKGCSYSPRCELCLGPL